MWSHLHGDLPVDYVDAVMMAAFSGTLRRLYMFMASGNAFGWRAEQVGHSHDGSMPLEEKHNRIGEHRLVALTKFGDDTLLWAGLLADFQ